MASAETIKSERPPYGVKYCGEEHRRLQLIRVSVRGQGPSLNQRGQPHSQSMVENLDLDREKFQRIFAALFTPVDSNAKVKEFLNSSRQRVQCPSIRAGRIPHSSAACAAAPKVERKEPLSFPKIIRNSGAKDALEHQAIPARLESRAALRSPFPPLPPIHNHGKSLDGRVSLNKPRLETIEEEPS